jgi:hypothetical protein
MQLIRTNLSFQLTNMTHHSNDMTFGWRSSAILSQWLDVPEISLRNWYLPHLMKNPDVMPYLFKAPQGHMDNSKLLWTSPDQRLAGADSGTQDT